MEHTKVSVSLKGLNKSFTEGERTRNVLVDLNADFDANKFHVILGRSGSGKSTLLNLISGIDMPDSGTVQVAGTILNEISERERTLIRRKSIGFIFQFFNLIPSLTVEENVMLPLELLKVENRFDRVRQVLDEVEMGDRMSSYPDALSGGEQQRIAIARAVVHEPELILADEPTGNLDDTTAEQVLRILTGITHQRTVLLVTHSQEAAHKADCKWILRSGMFEPGVN